jgi:2-phosphosulfolactate phosphatase
VTGSVLIDCYETGFRGPWDEWAVVTIDVLRASTTAVTAVAMGRRCFPADSLDTALALAARLKDPLMVGELGGNMPYGFHLTNSPALLEERSDLERPMVLLSTSGTALMAAARPASAVYACCLRNYGAQIRELIRHHPRVALVGAGSRREFREEDQLCCTWIADLLIEAGYQPLAETAAIVARWRDKPVSSILRGNSARYLMATNQERDLRFVVDHVDDLDLVVRLQHDELVGRLVEKRARPVARVHNNGQIEAAG